MSDPLITISQLLSKLVKSPYEPLENMDILPLKFLLKNTNFTRLQALSSLGLNSKDEIIEILLKLYEEILLRSIPIKPKNDIKGFNTTMEYECPPYSLNSWEQTLSFRNQNATIEHISNIPDLNRAKGKLKTKQN